MKYELSMFLSPKMTDEQAEKKTKELEKILAKFDAKILESNFLGMKDLAYPIKHFNQGYYFIVKIEADQTKIKKIRYQVCDELEAVRLLVTKQEKDIKLETENKVEGEVKELAIEDKGEVISEKKEEKKEKKMVEDKVEEKPILKKEKPEETDMDKKLDKILEEDIVD